MNAERSALALRGAAPFVTVVEAAEPGQGDDLGVTEGPGLPWAARGSGLGEAEVRTIVVVVRDVLADQAQQMTVVKDDDMVEELAPDAADPTFGDTVLPRAPWRGAGRLRAERSHHRNDLVGERAVAVEHEVTRSGVERERLAQLLCNPRRLGVIGTWK